MKGSALALLLLVALQALPGWAAPTTEIIPLRYASAEGLIPAIEPFLGQSERVSAYGNQIVLRAEPHRIDELQQLIADLDRRPARLRIHVASTGSLASSERGLQAGGRITRGPVDVVVGAPGESNRAGVTRRHTRGSADGTRQITANEGYPVFIHQGQSVPVTTHGVNAWGQPMEQTTYRDVTSGFYATVRLNGDQAIIDLSTSDDRVDPGDARRLDIRRSSTVVTARLGEWVTVGSLGDAEMQRESGIGRRTTTRRQDSQSIRIMVERLE